MTGHKYFGLSVPSLAGQPNNPESMANPSTHGRGAVLGAFLAIYGAVMQPQVIAQIPGKAGQIMATLAVFSPLVNAVIGAVGGVVAAASMPPGTPRKQSE